MDELTAVVSTDPELVLVRPLVEGHRRNEFYRPPAGLEAAIDVALWLGEPLLLTGDPGVGKTRAAHWLTARLGAERLLTCNVKSTSTGVDLLYSFDEVARFRDSSNGTARPMIAYLRFNGLGEAILRGAGGRAVLLTGAGVALDSEAAIAGHRAALDNAFGEGGWQVSDGAVRLAALLPHEPGFAAAAPAHRVLLIDELDKAPRDTPNDLLNEVETLSFRIPELDVQVACDSGRRPIIVVTSNSEKSLPDPFLRRCVYFDIPFPGSDEMAAIVTGSLGALEGGGPMIGEALALFDAFRAPAAGLRKRPGTAELIAWLDVMVHAHGIDAMTPLITRLDAVKSALTAVLKVKEDLEVGQRIVDDWARKARPA